MIYLIRILRYFLRMFLLPLILTGCGAAGTTHVAAPPPTAVPTALAWPAADALFRSDPHWLGADGAYSVHLGGDRTLWLFGQSFVEPTGTGDRFDAFAVSNTIAIQDGLDPSGASIEFIWRDDAGAPGAFFADEGTTWFWPSHGIRIGDVLTVFLKRVRAVPQNGPFDFEVLETVAVRIGNVDDDPLDWILDQVPLPGPVFSATVGTSVVRAGGFVMAFALDRSDNSEAYVLRWPEADFAEGRLLDPQWWVGGLGWVPDAQMLGAPSLLFNGASSDYSVTPDPTRPRYVEVQSQGVFNAFDAQGIAVRFADRPEGPYTALRTVFTPFDLAPDRYVNAGKAHAQLLGADVVATYVPTSVNGITRLVDDELLYPRFVRLTFP